MKNAYWYVSFLPVQLSCSIYFFLEKVCFTKQDNTFSWLCSSSAWIQSPAPLSIVADKQKTLFAKYFCLRVVKLIAFPYSPIVNSELMHSIKTTPCQKYTYIMFYLYFMYFALQQLTLKPFKS